MISFDEARERLLQRATATRLGTETVSLEEALDRVLAEPLTASADVPAFSASTMDGYAICTRDLVASELPRTLPVVAESRAGSPVPPLARGTTCRIFTGAPLPDGADAVEMQEEVTRDGDRATFVRAAAPGRFVRARGDDLRAGAVALEAGVLLGPTKLALAAALDRGSLVVGRRPRVVLLSTGDELRAPGTSGGPTTIADSNTTALRAIARRAGAIVTVAPTAPDDPDATGKAIEAALRDADVLVTVGGASVGDHDYVKPALEACGVTVDFWRVALKPGKPMLVGARDHVTVLGLPGNPVSAQITFALFGVPLLRALQGDRSPYPTTHPARLAIDVTRDAGRLEFARARLTHDGTEPIVTPLANQASGAVAALAVADALAIYPLASTHLRAGDRLDVLTLASLGLG